MPEISRFLGIVITMFYNDRTELIEDWQLARAGKPLKQIAGHE